MENMGPIRQSARAAVAGLGGMVLSLTGVLLFLAAPAASGYLRFVLLAGGILAVLAGSAPVGMSITAQKGTPGRKRHPLAAAPHRRAHG